VTKPEATAYAFSVRGPTPPDIAERISAMHVAAVLAVEQGKRDDGSTDTDPEKGTPAGRVNGAGVDERVTAGQGRSDSA
jgi:hypothetical protein